MSMEDFSNNVLGHPDIPEDITSYLYQKFCRGAFRLTLSNFILGVTILTKAPLSVREGMVLLFLLFFANLCYCKNFKLYY